MHWMDFDWTSWRRQGLLGCLVLGVALWLTKGWLWPAPVIFYHPHEASSGLQVGDRAYSEGTSIGQVVAVHGTGQRLVAEVHIDGALRGEIAEDTLCILWSDPRDPERRALRFFAARSSGRQKDQ